MKFKTFLDSGRLIVLFLSISGLTPGCSRGGGGGGGGGGKSSVPADATVSGQAAKGPINGGAVTAYAVTPSGTKGAALNSSSADVKTDANGNYSISIPHSGPILLEVAGGNYEDEVDGATIHLTATLEAAVAGVTPGSTHQVQITPLTALAVALALNTTGGLTPANIDAANR